MASLTIRNLENDTRQILRLRAARHGNSLAEEVRMILRRVASEEERPGRKHGNLYDAIRELVEPHGGFDLEIPERSLPSRDAPTEHDPAAVRSESFMDSVNRLKAKYGTVELDIPPRSRAVTEPAISGSDAG
ncbi:hypothetical protein MesoLjLc_00810 [Mesorhizobium sp. L-8-10]|uniref:FitA-like ribbon-helix-helix domain-containing protein n=1 Tax=Mesorhizobium sp. L-8-10 TaxID=2744523 RepID=UPI00193853CE|nr:hypothetical protein [Mesorhizobium sp. L-8-10]BCH28151.1 hypothetical protein MesoLjLc_00810 [Mesorhizobium sp. L-8-10]